MRTLQFLHNAPPPPPPYLNVQGSSCFKIEEVEHSAPSRFDVLLNCYI